MEAKKVKIIVIQRLIQKAQNRRPHWTGSGWRNCHKRNQVSPWFDFLKRVLEKKREN